MINNTIGSQPLRGCDFMAHSLPGALPGLFDANPYGVF